MIQTRRSFVVAATGVIASGVAGFFSAACDSAVPGTSPIPTAPSPPQPPQIRAQLVAPSRNHVFEIRATDQFNSVDEAMRVAGLTADIRDNVRWLTTSGQSFSGGLVIGLRGPSDSEYRRGNWNVRIGTHRLCFDVRNQSVPAGTNIGFFYADGAPDSSGCA